MEVEQQEEGVRVIRANLESKEDALLWLKEYQEEECSNFIVADPMSSDPKRFVFLIN